MASIQRRGTSWRAVIRRTGHTTQIKTFPLKAAAERWATKVEREMDLGEFADRRSCDVTGAAIAQQYADEISPAKKGKRWEQVRLKKLARVAWMQKPLNRVTADDIQKWRKAQTISGASLRREMNLLNSVFNYAKKHWHPVQNPLAGVSKPADSKSRERRPSQAELGAIRTHFQKKPGMALLVELAIETAMRLGELCSLDWKDVYLDECYVQLHDTKNGTARKVPLSKTAIELLQARTPAGKVIGVSAATAGVYWRKACKELGITDLHFHDLRHEATTRMAAKVPNAMALAKITGHKDLKMLSRYYNPSVGDLAKLLN